MKKMYHKLWIMMGICVLLCGGLAGCGNAGKSETGSYVQNNADADGFGNSYIAATEAAAMNDEVSETASEAAGESKTSQYGNQKIIKRYEYSYETEEFDNAYTYLRQRVEEYQGYVSSSNIEGSGYRVLWLTARIPAENSDSFVNGLGNLGTVISQSESAEDVTLQYTDTESRIEALKTEQKRLNELLEKADNLENMIALEERLTEVRYELENYQSQKKLYDNLISYSTIRITLQEVSYTVAVDDSTFFSRIATGLEGSLRDIKEGLLDFLVWLIISLPYLVIWGIVIWIVVKIIGKVRKHRKAKKQKKMAPEEEEKKE